MKKLIPILSIILLAACTKPVEINYMVFSGLVKNSETDSIIVGNKDFRKAIAIKDDGSFSDTLIIENGNYSFRIER